MMMAAASFSVISSIIVIVTSIITSISIVSPSIAFLSIRMMAPSSSAGAVMVRPLSTVSTIATVATTRTTPTAAAATISCGGEGGVHWMGAGMVGSDGHGWVCEKNDAINEAIDDAQHDAWRVEV